MQEQPTEAPYNPYLFLTGNVIDDLGQPVNNTQVQFWHTDYHGNYFHPGDDLDGKELMKDSFSYFGTATTNTKGKFDFKTYRPGIYPERPVTHIHFKVFYDGKELLTSQFYFEDEGVDRWYDDMVILKLQEGSDEDGNLAFHTNKQIVVNMREVEDMNVGLKLTPPDVEGPFYPLVDFFDVGSDMTSGLLRKFLTNHTTTFVPTSKPSQKPSSRPSSRPSSFVLPWHDDFGDSTSAELPSTIVGVDSHSSFDESNDEEGQSSINRNSWMDAFEWSWTPEAAALFERRKQPTTDRFGSIVNRIDDQNPSDAEIQHDSLPTTSIDTSLSITVNSENIRVKERGTSPGKRFLRSIT